jgi:endonuclease YncB( thermonuclease family)
VTGEQDGSRQYARAEARVLDVLDRGKMLTDTGEIVKLRGVRVSSERDPNEVVAFYAREATRVLRAMTLEGAVTIDFAEPLRSGDGTLMGIVYLRDGTELNRLILERGLARTEPADFPDDRRLFELEAAEQRAKDAKIGVWSARK